MLLLLATLKALLTQTDIKKYFVTASGLSFILLSIHQRMVCTSVDDIWYFQKFSGISGG